MVGNLERLLQTGDQLPDRIGSEEVVRRPEGKDLAGEGIGAVVGQEQEHTILAREPDPAGSLQSADVRKLNVQNGGLGRVLVEKLQRPEAGIRTMDDAGGSEVVLQGN